MATMTRQNYELLARTLGYAVAVEACEGGGEGSRAAGAAYRVALAVAQSLRDTNPAYDEARFLDAVDKHANKAGAMLSGEAIREDRGAGHCLADAQRQRLAHTIPYSRINV